MNKIDMYTYLCYASIVLCLLCLVIAVVLFFYYDMRSVIGYLTGHSAKKEIRMIEEKAADRKKPGKSNMYPGKLEEKKVSVSLEKKVPVSSVKKVPVSPEKKTEPERTEELKGIVKSKDAYDETTTLSQIAFVIERERLVIHTEEII